MYKTSTKAIISWTILVVFISISQPAKLPVWGLIIPFILLYFAVHYSVRLAFERKGQTNVRMRAVQRWLPIVVAISAVIVLALQSIGQLSARDVIAVVLVILLGYFYVHRNASKQKK